MRKDREEKMKQANKMLRRKYKVEMQRTGEGEGGGGGGGGEEGRPTKDDKVRARKVQSTSRVECKTTFVVAKRRRQHQSIPMFGGMGERYVGQHDIAT